MLRRDDGGQLIDPDQPDTLLGLANTMGTGTNLQRATVVILCEPVYDPKVKAQVPKRAHRQGNLQEVWYYQLTSQTKIEQLVETKEAAKAGFTAEAFEFTAGEMLRQGAEVAGRASMDETVDVVDGTTVAGAIDVDDMDVEESGA